MTVKKPFIDTEGRKLLLCASNEITDLVHRIACEEANTEILSKVAGELDFEAVLQDMADVLSSRMNTDRILFVKCNPDGLLRLEKEWCAPGVASISDENLWRHYEIWDKYAYILRQNEIIKIPDIENSDIIGGKLRRNSKYKTVSLIVAPIFVERNFWGAIFVSYSNSKLDFTDVDESLMRSCSNVISIAHIRDRQQREILKSDFEKKMILDNIKVPIWLHDAKGNLLRGNTAVFNFAGINESELEPLALKKFYDSVPETLTIPIREVIKTKKPVQGIATWLGRELVLNANPIFGDKGELNYIVKSAVDVTEINMMIRKQEIVNFCLETFFKVDDVKNALSLVLEKICEYLGATSICIMRFNFKEMLYNIYIEHSTTQKHPIFNRNEFPFSTDEQWFCKLQNNENINIEDIKKDADADVLGVWKNHFIEASISSLYDFPLICNKELWGSFAIIYKNKPHSLGKFEKDFIGSAKHLVELLLDRDFARRSLVDALDKTRKSEREKDELLANELSVNNCLNTLFTGSDIDKAIRSVMEIILKHMNASNVFCMRFDEEKHFVSNVIELSNTGERNEVFGVDNKMKFSPDEKWYRDFSEGRLSSLHDLLSEKELEYIGSWRKKIQGRFKSAYASGIHAMGKLWGSIGVVYKNEHYEPTDLELKFLFNAGHLIEILMERKLSRDKIIESLNQAKAANKAKSFFIASVSHEIRTPLNAVIGFSELLKNGGVSEKDAREYLDNIVFSGNSLLQLVNDVLDLSKLEAGQMQIISEFTDFQKLGDEVMRIFEHGASKNGVKFKTQIDKLPMLYLDKSRIRQILFNLIGNAAKFTPSGSITLRAEFRQNSESSGEFEFSVSDTGIGISEDDQKKLMEPFVQLSKMRGTNASSNGTGLGLSICKRLAEKMGGNVWLTSKEGVGSTFGITLSDVKIADAAALTATVKNDIINDGGKKNNKENLSILIVDDVPLNIKVLKSLLISEGISDIADATSGADALAKMQNRRFDMVLTDMWMPNMNGSELAKKIKSNPKFADAEIVAITADVEAKDNFSMQYFSKILLKPITLEKIRTLLGEEGELKKS